MMFCVDKAGPATHSCLFMWIRTSFLLWEHLALAPYKRPQSVRLLSLDCELETLGLGLGLTLILTLTGEFWNVEAQIVIAITDWSMLQEV